MNTCEQCRFWHHLVGLLGECRRHSPRAADANIGVWPTTDADAWCGEFESRHRPAPRVPATAGIAQQRIPQTATDIPLVALAIAGSGPDPGAWLLACDNLGPDQLAAVQALPPSSWIIVQHRDHQSSIPTDGTPKITGSSVVFRIPNPNPGERQVLTPLELAARQPTWGDILIPAAAAPTSPSPG